MRYEDGSVVRIGQYLKLNIIQTYGSYNTIYCKIDEVIKKKKSCIVTNIQTLEEMSINVSPTNQIDYIYRRGKYSDSRVFGHIEKICDLETMKLQIIKDTLNKCNM
jgi:hypothetical protein